MKKLLLLLLVLFIPFYVITKPNQIKYITYDFDQFDSLCIADTIPRQMSIWESYDYINEKEEFVTIYKFVKHDTIIYNVILLDDGYFNVNKSILK